MEIIIGIKVPEETGNHLTQVLNGSGPGFWKFPPEHMIVRICRLELRNDTAVKKREQFLEQLKALQPTIKKLSEELAKKQKQPKPVIAIQGITVNGPHSMNLNAKTADSDEALQNFLKSLQDCVVEAAKSIGLSEIEIAGHPNNISKRIYRDYPRVFIGGNKKSPEQAHWLAEQRSNLVDLSFTADKLVVIRNSDKKREPMATIDLI